jgi:hypothetical protein
VEAASGWANTVRTSVATSACVDCGTRHSKLRMKWVRHRYQLEPGRTAAIACFRP